MTSRTLMRASGMSDAQIDRHEALVRAGFTVREAADGYYLCRDGEVERGPFRSRNLAWQAAEGMTAFGMPRKSR